MTQKQRFELAIARYKDVTDQLRRWEATQIALGLSPKIAKAAVHKHLGTLKLFAIHDAMLAVDRTPSPKAVEVFEEEMSRFEESLKSVSLCLSNDGVPLE